MLLLKESVFSKQRVLVRLDLDLNDQEIAHPDHPRISRVIPTLNYLLGQDNKVLIIGHRGRPEGFEEQLSLLPFVQVFSSKLNKEVGLSSSLDQNEISRLLTSNQIVILENLRFHKEEEENDQNFGQRLANLAEGYVFEAFGMAHREHASVVGIPKYLKTYAGLNFEKEVEVLSKIKHSPERPFVAVIGGAKLETKEEVIGSLLRLADKVLVGGKLIETPQSQDPRLVKPKDVIMARKDQAGWVEESIEEYQPLGDGEQKNIVDLGPKTIKEFQEAISTSATVIWNGPMGVYEDKRFSSGTKEIAQAIVYSPAFKVVGGGETLSFILENNLIDKFDHVSLGGGAMLEFFAKNTLPALEALGWKS